MTCLQLGWACAHEFHADTFEEMAELSKAHGMEMMQKQDWPHLEAMNQMMVKMQNPEEMKARFDGKRQEFDDLPHDD